MASKHFGGVTLLFGNRATQAVIGQCGGTGTGVDLARQVAQRIIVVAPIAHIHITHGPFATQCVDDVQRGGAKWGAARHFFDFGQLVHTIVGVAQPGLLGGCTSLTRPQMSSMVVVS